MAGPLTFLSEKIRSINIHLRNEKIRKRMFLLECRNNLSILDVCNWASVETNAQKFSVIDQLSCEMSLALLSNFENDFIHNVAEYISSSTVEEGISEGINLQDEPDSKLLLMISKIQTLQAISKLSKSQIDADNARLTMRIGNLKRLIISVMKDTRI